MQLLFLAYDAIVVSCVCSLRMCDNRLWLRARVKPTKTDKDSNHQPRGWLCRHGAFSIGLHKHILRTIVRALIHKNSDTSWGRLSDHTLTSFKTDQAVRLKRATGGLSPSAQTTVNSSLATATTARHGDPVLASGVFEATAQRRLSSSLLFLTAPASDGIINLKM